MDKLKQKLEERKKEGNYRKLSVREGLIDFYSNDYLGLAKNRELYEMIKLELSSQSYNINGSTGSRLLSGNSKYFLETEERLAVMLESEKTLLFNSGYSANLSILSSVPQKGDTILYDELIHASLKEGARLSFAKRFSFNHNDVKDLESKIVKAEGNCYVVIESVYSMDGDFAPLKEMVEVCEKHGAYLILDEAHSTGIWGNAGQGIAFEKALHKRIFARIYTFGKAMGIHGACIAGSELLIDFLINFARPFIYTTAMSPHGVASINAVYTYLQHHSSSIALFDKIKFYKQLIQKDPLILTSTIESESAIQVIKVSGNTVAKQLAEKLIQDGFDVRPILSPTVKEGEERLRICLHTYNTKEQITQLVASIQKQLIL
jgi:8-amino-7-oxononanoate synthase